MKNYQTPRQLSDCNFNVGHAESFEAIHRHAKWADRAIYALVSVAFAGAVVMAFAV